MREDDRLRRTAFSRRVSVDFGDEVGHVFVHSPEDIIIYKLICYSLSQQSTHIRDIASIMKVKSNDLDYGYIQKWAAEKELIDIWKYARDEDGH